MELSCHLIVTDHGLDDQMIDVHIPTGVGNFSLHHRVQAYWGSGSVPPQHIRQILQLTALFNVYTDVSATHSTPKLSSDKFSPVYIQSH
jgi:hypothetical protein